MSTSQGSETADSMDDDTSQVSHGRRSKVWEHYEQELVVVEGDPKAVCKYCRGQFHTKFGTSSLELAISHQGRVKEDYLDFFYCKLSTNEEEVSNQVEVALEWVRKYFKEYELLVATSTAHSTPSSQGNTTIGSPIVGKRKLEEEFAQHKSRRRTRVHKSELDAYLEEASEEDGADFDVLGWWKRHAEKFPILATMARDFLAIPLSTVASEAAFSCGKRILGDSRSSLTPHMLEALVCAKDWLFIPKKVV